MQKKLKKDGLVAMSVNLDDSEDEKSLKNARAFIKEQKADFAHFHLTEDPDSWQKKLDISGPPVVFVFARDGKLAKKFDEGVDYAEVEKFVVDLLKK
jgi:hypothetical protein